MSELIQIITADDPAVRNRSLDAFCRSASLAQLREECASLDHFRRAATTCMSGCARSFSLCDLSLSHSAQAGSAPGGLVPFDGYDNLLKRRFEEAIDIFLAAAAERRHCQRPGRSLPAAGLPDAGQPGAAQRALGARQPVDVPHRPSGRPSAAGAAGAVPASSAGSLTANVPLSRSSTKPPPCAWT